MSLVARFCLPYLKNNDKDMLLYEHCTVHTEWTCLKNFISAVSTQSVKTLSEMQ